MTQKWEKEVAKENIVDSSCNLCGKQDRTFQNSVVTLIRNGFRSFMYDLPQYGNQLHKDARICCSLKVIENQKILITV